MDKCMEDYNIIYCYCHGWKTAFLNSIGKTTPLRFIKVLTEKALHIIIIIWKLILIVKGIANCMLFMLALVETWRVMVHGAVAGFTPSEISQIQQKAEGNHKLSSVGSVLMSEWARREPTSTAIVLHSLASINRLDLVALIQNSNSMKGSEIV